MVNCVNQTVGLFGKEEKNIYNILKEKKKWSTSHVSRLTTKTTCNDVVNEKWN